MTNLDVHCLWRKQTHSCSFPHSHHPLPCANTSVCAALWWSDWCGLKLTQQKILPNLYLFLRFVQAAVQDSEWVPDSRRERDCLFWQPCWLLLAWFEHKVWRNQTISSSHLANQWQSQKKTLSFLMIEVFHVLEKEAWNPLRTPVSCSSNAFGLHHFSQLAEPNMSVFWGVLHYKRINVIPFDFHYFLF